MNVSVRSGHSTRYSMVPVRYAVWAARDALARQYRHDQCGKAQLCDSSDGECLWLIADHRLAVRVNHRHVPSINALIETSMAKLAACRGNLA